jgi:hypothetical protein
MVYLLCFPFIDNYETNRYNQRKHQRNHKNLTKSTSLVDKMLYITTTGVNSVASSDNNNNNSPYVILINEDSSSANLDDDLETEEPKSSLTNSDRSALNINPQPDSGSNRISNSICFVLLFNVVVHLALT